MKKTLLTLAAVAMAAGAWAQETTSAPLTAEQLEELGYENVTPGYYNFYKGQTIIDAMLRADLTSPGMPSLNNGSFISSNYNNADPDAYFNSENLSNGNVMFGGAYRTTQSDLAAGFSYYDLGAPIGNALILNGFQSELDEAIKDYFDLSATPEIAKMEKALAGNLQIFWIFDYLKMNSLFIKNDEPEALKVRVRFEVNGYNNDMTTDKEVFNAFTKVDEQNNEIPRDATYPVLFNEFADENGNWDPTKWKLIEIEMPYNRIASYMRLTVQNAKTALNTGALLIRNLEIYEIPQSVETGLTTNTYESYWMDYSAVDEPTTPPVDLYLVGANVDGEEWNLGTNPMTYADGVYTWTGSVLGNGFKINNGTWSDADYNIGSDGSALLELGVPYDVIADKDSQDIRFDGYTSVENVTVVYNPTDMTVTVTGDGVNAPVGPSIPELYVRGVMNDWGTTAQMTEEDGVYTYKFDLVTADAAEFKIADDSWSTYNYGGQNMSVYCNNPGVQKLVYQGDNVKIDNWVDGPMEITFVLDTLELTVVGTNQPEDPSSAIEAIDTENAPVEYYNLQGVKVNNPEKGIYLKKQGNTTTKVIVK